MLRHFRTVFKSNQMPVMGVMLVVTLGMVAYLAPSGARNAPDAVLARVYGRDVSLRDAQLEARSMSDRLKMQGQGQYPTSRLLGYAVETLIQNKVIEEMAERHGVVITDDELRIALETSVRAELNGRPDLLTQFFGSDNHLKPLPELEALPAFVGRAGGAKGFFRSKEAELRERLMMFKLRNGMSLEVPVDAAWVEAENRFRNEKLDADILTLTIDTKDVADPGDATLQAYLQQSGTRFQEGPRRTLQIAVADRATMDLKVDEATLKTSFDNNKSKYVRPADSEIRVRHILFAVKTPGDVAAVTKKAEALRAELVKGRDFQKAAEELSDDPTAKGNGGEPYDGFFTRGKALEGAFDSVAFGLQVGEISQPVRTKFGVHLIKLEDAKPKAVLTFDQVKDRIMADLQTQAFERKAKERLEELKKRAGGGDLSNGARALGLTLLTPAPLSADAREIPGLPGGQMLLQDAFTQKVGTVGTVMPVGATFALMRVQQEWPVAVPPLKEVRAKVLAAWQTDEAKKRLMAKVQEALKTGDLKSLGAVRTETGKSPSELSNGNDALMRQTLLQTAVGQTTAAVWMPKGQLWVARVNARTAAPALTFETRRQLVSQLQAQSANKRFEAERMALLTEGRKHAGFSSFWGHFNGIYEDKSLLKLATGAGAEEE